MAELNLRDKFYSFRKEWFPLYLRKLYHAIFSPNKVYLLAPKKEYVEPERFVSKEIKFLGYSFKYVDFPSFQFIKQEVFDYKIYEFKTSNPKPFIIDCGANIGLSVIFFKQLFPESEIIAFEPDKKVHDALEFNVQSFDLKNVKLVQKALWKEETILEFMSEGADGGRVAKEFDNHQLIKVDTDLLSKYLKRPVDFLKIDIEGAETTVLEECQDLLCNVDKMFVEYHSFENSEQELDQLLQILKNAGFRYNVQHIGVFSRQPYLEIKSSMNMDNQLNIFAYKTK